MRIYHSPSSNFDRKVIPSPFHCISGKGAQVMQCGYSGPFPTFIPKDLAPRLRRLHGRPLIWWLGQFLKYMTKPTDEHRADLENATRSIGFANPIVG